MVMLICNIVDELTDIYSKTNLIYRVILCIQVNLILYATFFTPLFFLIILLCNGFSAQGVLRTTFIISGFFFIITLVLGIISQISEFKKEKSRYRRLRGAGLSGSSSNPPYDSGEIYSAEGRGINTGYFSH